MADFIVRGLDDAAMTKIESLAAKSGCSRNAFIVKSLESLAIMGELKELEDKYKNLVNVISEVVKVNTEAIDRNTEVIKKILGDE